MSSVARHHAEWLSLVEVSGPFLSMPVLLEVFPDGLDKRADQSDLRERLQGQGGGRRGDAVGKREGGDGHQQTPPATDDEEQRQHEQQVIEAEQDVRDTQLQVLPGHRPRQA